MKAQFGDAAPVVLGYITFNHREGGGLMYCIIDIARRAEREMLCLHLPVLVFAHSYNLLTVRASVRFFKGLAANLVSRRVNEENVGKV